MKLQADSLFCHAQEKKDRGRCYTVLWDCTWIWIEEQTYFDSSDPWKTPNQEFVPNFE